MNDKDPQLEQRRILLAATAGMGGIGLVATAVPFIESMSLSEAAKAAGAPVEAELGRIRPGQMTVVEWRGRPVWILHRTEDMLRHLAGNDKQLADPLSAQPQQPPYAQNSFRSIKPEYFLAIGICTHLGCVPVLRPETAPPDLGPDWPGGFYCPCHGSRFDLAGRVFKNVPAPRNLEIPPHAYLGETRLLIGEERHGT